jgi:hypothetical protein
MSKDSDLSDMLELIFRQAKAQFGSAIKSRWLYDGGGCPGCGREINVMKFKKKKALSLNAFIYREFGVLIAYFLCGKCARFIFEDAEKNPNVQTPLHDEIEKNLKKAFVKHLGH